MLPSPTVSMRWGLEPYVWVRVEYRLELVDEGASVCARMGEARSAHNRPWHRARCATRATPPERSMMDPRVRDLELFDS